MKNFIHLCIVISILFACKREDTGPSLPPATTTGANTAGCYVDGKPWIASSKSGFFNSCDATNGGATEVDFNDGSSRRYIWMWFTDCNGGGVVTIYLDTIPKIGQTFVCNKTTCPTPACDYYINYISNSDKDGFFMTDEKATGIVTFTNVSSVNGWSLFSGNFQCTVRNGSMTKKITDGRFDFVQHL